MKKTLLLILSLSLLVSCSKSTTSIDTSSARCNEVIPLSEAMANLNSVISSVYGNEPTKAADMIASVECLGSSNVFSGTKSQDGVFIPDTLMYLVNFSNDNGFAVLSANRMLGDKVFCVTDEGGISAEDFADAYHNLVVSGTKAGSGESQDTTFTDQGPSVVPSLIISNIMINISGTSSRMVDPDDDLNINIPESAGCTSYGPYLNTKWTQTDNTNSNFRKYTPNHRAPGCVVIAVGQIMLYNRHSNTNIFDGAVCNWSDMETVYNYRALSRAGTVAAQDQVGHFVKSLGEESNCDVNSDGASNALGAFRTFANYGYNNVSIALGLERADESIIDDMLSRGLPVYMDGTRPGLFSSGHAWVVDGVVGVHYYHINWGWHGMYDGYYEKGVFNTTSRAYKDAKDTLYELSTIDENFSWNYHTIIYNY